MNIVILKGNICRAPETRDVGKSSVTDFGIAVNRRWKDQRGKEKEEVLFADCSAWGRTGETIEEYFKKGSPILIQGRLRLEQWEDKKTDEKRSKISITVESFEFCNSGKDDDRGGRSRGRDRDRDDDDRGERGRRRSRVDDDDVPSREERERIGRRGKREEEEENDDAPY